MIVLAKDLLSFQDKLEEIIVKLEPEKKSPGAVVRFIRPHGGVVSQIF